MISGIGTDIIDIRRVEKLVETLGWEKFAQRILTKNEIAGLPENHEKRMQKLAKRFAAKEAIAKACGTGIGSELSFQDIEISNDENGKPIASIKKLSGKVHLSISDEHPYAVAYAVIEA